MAFGSEISGQGRHIGEPHMCSTRPSQSLRPRATGFFDFFPSPCHGVSPNWAMTMFSLTSKPRQLEKAGTRLLKYPGVLRKADDHDLAFQTVR